MNPLFPQRLHLASQSLLRLALGLSITRTHSSSWQRVLRVKAVQSCEFFNNRRDWIVPAILHFRQKRYGIGSLGSNRRGLQTSQLGHRNRARACHAQAHQHSTGRWEQAIAFRKNCDGCSGARWCQEFGQVEQIRLVGSVRRRADIRDRSRECSAVLPRRREGCTSALSARAISARSWHATLHIFRAFAYTTANS